MYKVASQNHRLRQFWGGSIPLSVRHKHKHPHPLVYLRGPEENIVIPIYMSEERLKVYECQLQKESEV